jgi:hypothetical protein
VSAPPVSSAERSAARAQRALDVVQRLARDPRAAGSEAETRARAYCAERLRAAGFEVFEEPFEYSAFPGRWGTPVGGVVALALLAGAGAAGRAGDGAVAILILTLGAALLAGLARWLARTGVLAFPLARRRSVNLVAKRRGASNAEPRVWLLAHLDSKSQPVPILVRAAGITLLGVVWIAELALAIMQAALGGGGMAGAWLALIGVAIVAAIPVIATTVGARSPGALDNATGVASVLAAAEEARGTHFGVCLTSAEELGLAGARSWVRGRPRGTPAVGINCDSVDHRGMITCMYSGSRPDALVASALAAGKRAGVPIRAHRLLPGVLTDGVALADAGWDVVTLSKGGARTLARIHTVLDRPDRLTGTGMDEVARVIVEMLEPAS